VDPRDEKKLELETLRARIRELEGEISGDPETDTKWAPQGFYTEYYATTGFILGMFGAAISLLANVVSAPVVNKSPLELIRVYLTFPLGEKALSLATNGQDVYAIGDGVILAVGCCLYLATGMLLGVPFFVALVWFTENKGIGYRLLVASILATLLWAVNFWGILSWLQPALFGGHWITDGKLLPTWVAWLTHLIFGWTLALLYPWTKFQPYQKPSTGES
jgi:hypothetical protein